MALTLSDKKYINSTMNQTMAHYMGALKESFEHQVSMLAELIQDRPTRNEVREMIKEETDPIKIRLTQIEGTLAI